MFSATGIVKFFCFVNPKVQGSSLLLGLYRPVCVGPCQKSKLLVFSCQGPNCFTDGVEDEIFNCDIDSIQSDISKLTLHNTHNKSHQPSVEEIKNDKAYVKGHGQVTRPCDHGDGHVTKDCESGEVNRIVNRQESEDYIPPDNGYFDLLPVSYQKKRLDIFKIW